MIRTTRTYVTLEVSEAAYQKIRAKLEAAGYEHCFEIGDEDSNGPIDMQGIALIPQKASAAR